jgi:hypothetical protein
MVLEHSRKQPLMTPDTPVSVRGVLLLHWPVYLMEGIELGLFMLSACVFGTLLFYTGSPVVHRMPSPLGRVILMGLVMGVTAVAIIRSPFGARSSAHFNPIISFTFFCLGRMHWVDMFCYIAAQFITLRRPPCVTCHRSGPIRNGRCLLGGVVHGLSDDLRGACSKRTSVALALHLAVGWSAGNRLRHLFFHLYPASASTRREPCLQHCLPAYGPRCGCTFRHLC